MAESRNWTREQLLVAFGLYCKLTFGQFHHRNPEIIRWAVRIGRTPSALAMKLGNIASLDPAITGSGRKGLVGASSSDRAMWREMHGDWTTFASAVEDAMEAFSTSPVLATEAIERSEVTGSTHTRPMPELPETFFGATRRTVTGVRVGQDFFRTCVLSAYQSRCCISGLAIPNLLVASHIVPWKDDEQNRLNPRNGLCLSALHDRAFDQGLIYLTDDLRVSLAPPLERRDLDPFSRLSLAECKGREIAVPEKFSPDLQFVRRHRKASKARWK